MICKNAADYEICEKKTLNKVKWPQHVTTLFLKWVICCTFRI